MRLVLRSFERELHGSRPLHTHARAIGNKLLLLGHIAVILDAFYQTCLHAEIHLLMHHGGHFRSRIQARLKVQRGNAFQNEPIKQNRTGRVPCLAPTNASCVSLNIASFLFNSSITSIFEAFLFSSISFFFNFCSARSSSSLTRFLLEKGTRI